jgi:hypothetical protein
MTAMEFDKFRHKAVHELMDLNTECEQRFQIGHWERWDYDLESGTLVFSHHGTPKVIAEIQVVGTTSKKSNTWMWGWANESLPAGVTSSLTAVREYGNTERLSQLTMPQLPDDEHLGWDMTAVAAHIIGAKGGYRCPSERGFLYVVYIDLVHAEVAPRGIPATGKTDRGVKCHTHGWGEETFICEHLVAHPEQPWFADPPTPENRWPDAWCLQCEQAYQEQGEWNDRNSGRTNIELLCHRCYESLSARSNNLRS